MYSYSRDEENAKIVTHQTLRTHALLLDLARNRRGYRFAAIFNTYCHLHVPQECAVNRSLLLSFVHRMYSIPETKWIVTILAMVMRNGLRACVVILVVVVVLPSSALVRNPICAGNPKVENTQLHTLAHISRQERPSNPNVPPPTLSPPASPQTVVRNE